MDLIQLGIQLGTQLLSEKLGLQVDAETISSALTNLLADGGGNLLDSVGGSLLGAASSFLK
jgi:hypothetical protein